MIADIHQCFESVNEFIAKARAQNKKVLVFDFAPDEKDPNSGR